CGHLDTNPADWLAVLPMPELRTLRLERCHLSDQVLARLLALPTWPRLHTLECGACSYPADRAVAVLVNHRFLDRLRRLTLGNLPFPALLRAFPERRAGPG